MKVIKVLSILLLLISSNVEAQVIVCQTCEVSSIAEGLELTNETDTLFILKGEYLEHDLIIDKALTIKGEDGVIINGEKQGTIIKVRSDNVHLIDFTIMHVGVSHTNEFAAVHLLESDHFSIENLTIKDAFFGILIEKSDHGMVTGNKVSGNKELEFYSGNGIHAWHSNYLSIYNNQIKEMRDGIYLEFVDESQINNNIATNNVRYGLHFMFSNNDDYSNNEFSENGAGVAVMFSKFIIMTGNKFHDNWGSASYGLLLKEIYDAEITNNEFERNTIAISVEGTTRVNYLYNDFNSNGWAIRVSGGCYKNLYSFNNFSNNSFDLAFNSKLNDNVFDQNYWSAYNGYDLDKNGIGDVPYRPVRLFSYLVNKTPETVVLLRSLFVDLLNFSETVAPVFTPVELLDNQPLMVAHAN